MAKAMILYGRILSPYTARCVIAARAKGIAMDLKLPPGSIRAAPFLKLNPLARIPVLVDGKTNVFESAVIVDYIDAKSRRNRLVPAAAKAVAQVRLAAAVAAEYVQTPAVDLWRHKRGTAAGPVDAVAAAAAMDKGLAVLEQVTAKGKFAGGAKFSVADCFLPPALLFAVRVAALFSLGDVFKDRPKLAKYWKAIQKDKRVKPVLADMNAMMDDALAGKLPPLH